MKTVTLTCETCDKTFAQRLQQYNQNLKRGHTSKYCSRECQQKRPSTANITVTCKQCNKEFLKNKRNAKRSPNHFCSKSCAGTYNNKHFPKRYPEGQCLKCGQPCSASRSYCKDHSKPPSQPYTDWSKVTYAEATRRAGSNKHSVIRHHAKTVFKPTECEECGYNKHVEICHIKAIHTFSQNALITEINSRDNLRGLCPNCHWEFDNLPRKEAGGR